MNISIRQEQPDILREYGRIPISFHVHTEFRAEPIQGGLGGIRLEEVPVEQPYVVDYDAEAGRGTERWLETFDLANWGILAAYVGEERAGGAVLAYDTPNVRMLDGRKDMAVLWDLRIRPDMRGSGIGTELMKQAADWARARDCSLLKIETQSYNAAACKFYAARGAVLGMVDRFAFPERPGASRVFWYLTL